LIDSSAAAAAGASGTSFSPAIVGAFGIAAVIVAIVTLAFILLRCKPRARGRPPPSDGSLETNSALTLSIEDAAFLASECGEFAAIDARPPLIEDSDNGLFPLDAEDPGGQGMRHSGLLVQSLLGQF
jgi:hypothetical protein